MSSSPLADQEIDIQYDLDDESHWTVFVLNDPVTLMSYVVLVLRRLFGFDEATATRLMLQVHNQGKAAVAEGTRDACLRDVRRLHQHGLQASMVRG
ncbi:ATP-dependent Clp protease adapter ClpS [Stomatohabitans albus]|uniref:ATP-dependent Clp protease adapter ClpS n=1 Tax=Stomatohabitans albus TaxID=3110766 RepID=UPI00300CD14A